MNFTFKQQRDFLRDELADLLQLWRSGFILVLDPSVSPLLSVTVGMKFLTSHGVKQVLMLDNANPAALDIAADMPLQVIYMLRPYSSIVDAMCTQVNRTRAAASRPDELDFTCIFVPQRTHLCESVMERKGLYGIITVSQFELDLVPIDPDVASLEIPGAFRDSYLYPDETTLYRIAMSLFNLQRNFGRFDEIVGKGEAAGTVSDMLRHLTEKHLDELLAHEAQYSCAVKVDRVVLVDRKLDTLTPMLTQLTYEGLIDEVIGIKCGTVQLASHMVAGQVKKQQGADGEAKPMPKTVKYPLRSEDQMFARLRNLNFGMVLNLLPHETRGVQAQLERPKQPTMAALKGFVEHMPELLREKKLVTTHVNIAEKITKAAESPDFVDILALEGDILDRDSRADARDRIERLIVRQFPLARVLRLVCLYCYVEGGMKPKLYDHFKTQILHSYGFSEMVTLHNLEKMGFIYEQGKFVDTPHPRPPFAKLNKAYRLVSSSEELDHEDPKDISYIFSASGYAPLSVRMVSNVLEHGNFSREDKLFPRPASFHINLKKAPGTLSPPGPDHQAKRAPSQAPSSNASTLEPAKDPKTSRKRFGILSKIRTASSISRRLSSSSRKSLSESKDKEARMSIPKDKDKAPPPKRSAPKRTTLFYFIGGVTYAEIAGIRFVSGRFPKENLLVAASSLVNGNSLLRSLGEKVRGGTAAGFPI